ncbi:copper-translocating P-type ATPase [Subtercola lobariae]|uniref:Copper-translocating P-type ATPase n=2 Tax=Subtercola lobariae TaxID=1588641 RepID=A0A917EX27_9MICO|nr:heavy metal translocating P-type ATPase [Subtercola lobariae]GGF29394.1 copper-translocating P-type ATPase [Subtercola lobariae]
MTQTGHEQLEQAAHEHAGHEHAEHEHAEHGHSSHGDNSGHSGHGEHSGHGDHVAIFRAKFWVTLVLAVPTVFFSSMFASILGYQVPDFVGSYWISPVIGTVIFFWGGAPFLLGGLAEIRSRRPGMMLLIAMAITVAFVASWITTLKVGSFDLDFWWELALLVVIMLLGHWIEMRALGAASGALDALAALLPDTAERVTVPGEVAPDGSRDSVVEVPLAELVTGDVVLVRSGARVPADGTVVAGTAALDESMITGESMAVRRGQGDRVIAGTVATDNAIRVRVTAVGDGTALAGIQRLVADAQNSSSRAQALADRAAAWLFNYAAGAGIITFVVWVLLGNVDNAVTRTVTVLVIACPHALGLAIPLVIAISTERAARAGVLVKNRLALERMRTIDVVLFDKTGTLTRGEPAVTGAVVARDTVGAAGPVSPEILTPATLLSLAAAVEADSEHPLARAIVKAAAGAADAGARAGAPVATEFSSATGLGVHGRVDGTLVSVGGPAMLRASGAAVPTDIAEAARAWAERGSAVLYVLRAVEGVGEGEGEGDNCEVLGALALDDEVRPESRQAVEALHARGVRVAMITGDAHSVAASVAAELGIDEFFADVLPADKDQKVAELQARGLSVAMVGDGVNDAPALARADVGIAVGGGTDVAIESAGVVLVANDPRAVLSVIQLSRASYRKMVQNLVWAAGYNVLSVPLAAGVLAPIGFVLSPAVGAILMSLSTIIVAANAQLLRRVDLDPARLSARASGSPATER